jgi:hypothetical protein
MAIVKPSHISSLSTPIHRSFASSSSQLKSPFSRPGPPPLPAAEQAEFEELVKANQTIGTAPQKEDDIIEHRDIRKGPRAQFEGDINPKTGEHGGPKTDPFIAGEGDWQFGGRVTVSLLICALHGQPADSIRTSEPCDI